MSAKHSELLVAVPILLLLASCTGAVRETAFLQDEEGRSWEKKTYEFCVNEEHDIECGGVPDVGGTVDQLINKIEIWYNHKKKMGTAKQKNVRDCEQTKARTSSAESCDVKYAENVKKCEGKQKCRIVPSDHPHCDSGEFSGLRLTITCGSGTPMTPLDSTLTRGLFKQPGETRKTEDLGPKWRSMWEPHAGADGSVSTSTEAPLVLEYAAQIGDVLEKVTKEVDNPDITDIELVPCYRFSRSHKIFKQHEFFGDWSHWEFLARLTNCGHDEGCFMVKFPGGVAYVNETAEPASSEIVKGELVKAHDEFWVTWRGLGLKRNDYNTWGVCLPKTRDMDFAVLQWDELRRKALMKEGQYVSDDQKKVVYEITGEHVSTRDEVQEAFRRWDARMPS